MNYAGNVVGRASTDDLARKTSQMAEGFVSSLVCVFRRTMASEYFEAINLAQENDWDASQRACIEASQDDRLMMRLPRAW